MQDRPWNNPGPRNLKSLLADIDVRPTLKAIILDCSSVNVMDVTSVQALIDVRNQLDRYVTPDTVHWHFAGVKDRWTRRGLAAGGFGLLPPPPPPTSSSSVPDAGIRWKPVFSAAEVLDGVAPQPSTPPVRTDVEVGKEATEDDKGAVQKDEPVGPTAVPVYGLNRPLFHPDLQEALDSAIANVQGKSH